MSKTSQKLKLVTAFTVSAMLGMGTQTVMAQDDVQTMPGMDSGSMSTMDSDSMPGMQMNSMPDMQSQPGKKMDSGSMQGQGAMQDMQGNSMPNMNNGSMQDQGEMSGMNTQGNTTSMSGDMAGMDVNSMRSTSQAAGTRDPHAYSDGYTLDSGAYALPGPRQMRLADEHSFASLLVEKLERVKTTDAMATAYDVQAWFGRDYDRALLRAEGEHKGGKLEEAKSELLWSHAISTFWNTNVGIRHDGGEGPVRNWLAVGVQGLAPYWFELDATAYAGDKGRSALTLTAEYEMLFTQRLILQPKLEANFYGKEDAERGIGTGLSDVTAGLRLRYEIRREFAPYIGAEWAGLYGKTADYARDAGVDTKETRLVAGLRFWF